MVKNEQKFSLNVPAIRENPKCRKFPGKAGNEKTKIADFQSPMGWISILKAVLESVQHADQFEYKVDNFQDQM